MNIFLRKLRRNDLPECMVSESLGVLNKAFSLQTISPKTGEEKRYYDEEARKGEKIIEEKVFFRSKDAVIFEDCEVILDFIPPARGNVEAEKWCTELEDTYRELHDSYSSILENLVVAIEDFLVFRLRLVCIKAIGEHVLVFSNEDFESVKDDWYCEIIVSLSRDLSIKDISRIDY